VERVVGAICCRRSQDNAALTGFRLDRVGSVAIKPRALPEAVVPPSLHRWIAGLGTQSCGADPTLAERVRVAGCFCLELGLMLRFPWRVR
jgi:hypothetical protein